MKRIISVILTVLLVSALAFSFTASAEEEFGVSVKLPETFEAGETIDITLTLDKVPADPQFAIVNIVYTGAEIEIKGQNEVANVEVTGANAAVLDICIIDDDGMLSFTLDATKNDLPAGTTFVVKAKVLSDAKEVTATVDTESSSIFAGEGEYVASASSAKSALKVEEGPVVTIDVDTTGWTFVDGENVGTWQTALDKEEDPGDMVGTYCYNLSVVDGKYVVEVVFSGELSGTAESFGNGAGTNVRLWIHSGKNGDGEDTLAYNCIIDISYKGGEIAYRAMPNTVTTGNKADSTTYAYDAEKPFMTVESVIPTAKDGLYVKAVFTEIPNVTDNGDVVAVVTVSNKPTGKNNNALHSNSYEENNGPWNDATWSTYADSTAKFYPNASVVDPEDPSEDPSEEPSEDPSEEPSEDEPSEVVTPSSEPSSEEPSSPITGDTGVAAIALLALVTAAGVFVVRKVR